MASAIFQHLQLYWPFSLLKPDDLKDSSTLVRRLPVPEHLKQFIFAFPDKKTGTVVYILAVQNLSEQSVSDAKHVIKEIRPDAVVAQIAPSALPEIQVECETLDDRANSVPTSSFGVLGRCFKDKFNRRQYENLAGSLIVREIFGTGFFGHVQASKVAADEIDACFLMLESPSKNACALAPEVDSRNASQINSLQGNNLLSRKVVSAISPSSKSPLSLDSTQQRMLKTVTQTLSASFANVESTRQMTGDCQVIANYNAPPFAEAVYSLLEDLHGLFVNIPAIGKAMTHAQKMLSDINNGEPVDAKTLSEVHNFRLAVEGLRIALNNTGRCPLDKMESESRLEFDLLPPEDKSDALFTQALKNQTKNFRSIVAVVDAGSLSTLRRHWNTAIPPDAASLADDCLIRLNSDADSEDAWFINGMSKKRLLSDTPVIAVGAGATAVVGASSLSKVLPASTLVKLVTYKIPTLLKFGFLHLQRAAAVGLSNVLAPTKVIAPGIASKISSIKMSASAEKIRGVTHSVISFTERTSLLATRTAFYEIMRKRHARPIRLVPWATFCCSMGTCIGLLSYGDRIECAAESVPSAPTIALWGRGLRSLQHASQEARQVNREKIQDALKSLMCNLNKMKIQ